MSDRHGRWKSYLWGMLNGIGLCAGLSSLLTTRPLPAIEAWGMLVVVAALSALHLRSVWTD